MFFVSCSFLVLFLRLSVAYAVRRCAVLCCFVLSLAVSAYSSLRCLAWRSPQHRLAQGSSRFCPPVHPLTFSSRCSPSLVHSCIHADDVCCFHSFPFLSIPFHSFPFRLSAGAASPWQRLTTRGTVRQHATIPAQGTAPKLAVSLESFVSGTVGLIRFDSIPLCLASRYFWISPPPRPPGIWGRVVCRCCDSEKPKARFKSRPAALGHIHLRKAHLFPREDQRQDPDQDGN